MTIWDETGICILTPKELPCRFQIDEKVMSAGSECTVQGVYFAPGSITYALVREDGYAAMTPSDKVEPIKYGRLIV